VERSERLTTVLAARAELPERQRNTEVHGVMETIRSIGTRARAATTSSTFTS
jgi:hypothetical protein